jgi:hypothetical protein
MYVRQPKITQSLLKKLRLKRQRHEGIPYVFGDGDSKHAPEFAPDLDVVARSHENNEIDLLTQMGAHVLSALGETKRWVVAFGNTRSRD